VWVSRFVLSVFYMINLSFNYHQPPANHGVVERIFCANMFFTDLHYNDLLIILVLVMKILYRCFYYDLVGTYKEMSETFKLNDNCFTIVTGLV
jgi:hypothetical protein